MARPLRIEFPGALYYVTSRGKTSRKIFQNPADPVEWLDILGNICNRYRWVVYTYCLMPDHYHLVVQTPDANLSIGMRQLNGIYTQSYNEKYSSKGHLYKGRFKSVHVQKDAYLHRLARFILNSPVRSGFVKYPYQYKWSSCRFLRGSEDPPSWLNMDWCDNEFMHELLTPEFYRGADQDKNILNDVRKQIFLGDYDFERKVKQYSRGIGRNPGSTFRTDESIKSELSQFSGQSENRDEAIYRAYYSGKFSMKQIGDHFSIHYSTVSRIIKAYEEKLG